MLDPIVRAYVYRWPDNPCTATKDYTVRAPFLAPILSSALCHGWSLRWLEPALTGFQAIARVAWPLLR